jgi:hypothetical protein
MSRRLIALLLVSFAALTACGRVSATQPAAAGYRIFLEEGFNGGSERITVRDSGSGALERELPLGTPAPDWSRYYTVTPVASSARLTALDPSSGRTIAQATIPRGYWLPSLGYQGPTAGLSPNGQWLALTDNGSAITGKLVTSFLVGPSSLNGPFKAVHVDGDFSFDALSNTGQSLDLIQRMGDPNHYQVRLLDVASGTLVEHPVADKRDSSEPMNGIRGDSLADSKGQYVFTVYAREAGPFIHALPLDQPFAWCIDLPAKSASDMEEQFHWSLAFNPQRSILYAVNSSSGRIAEIVPDSLPSVGRTAQLALNPSHSLLASVVTEADAKGAPLGGAAVSADGRTLFALGNSGILVIDTASLKVRAHILDGMESVDSIRLSSDGQWLYAAQAGSSKVWQVNPVTGALSGLIPGTTNPWAILWAAPK